MLGVMGFCCVFILEFVWEFVLEIVLELVLELVLGLVLGLVLVLGLLELITFSGILSPPFILYIFMFFILFVLNLDFLL